MRGFLVGTLALVAVYVFVQPNAANVATTGGNAIVQGLRRLLSADVAGIPQRKGGAATQTSSTGTAPSGTVIV